MNWTYQKVDGTQIPVAPGKTAGIAKGVKILFPESTGSSNKDRENNKSTCGRDLPWKYYKDQVES